MMTTRPIRRDQLVRVKVSIGDTKAGKHGQCRERERRLVVGGFWDELQDGPVPGTLGPWWISSSYEPERQSCMSSQSDASCRAEATKAGYRTMCICSRPVWRDVQWPSSCSRRHPAPWHVFFSVRGWHITQQMFPCPGCYPGRRRRVRSDVVARWNKMVVCD